MDNFLYLEIFCVADHILKCMGKSPKDGTSFFFFLFFSPLRPTYFLMKFFQGISLA